MALYSTFRPLSRRTRESFSDTPLTYGGTTKVFDVGVVFVVEVTGAVV